MSPSAYLRGDVQGMFYTLHWLRAPRTPRRAGRERLDGLRARDLEGAAARRCSNRSACRTRARASSTTRRRRSAAREGLRFPVVVKANIGGSGAGIVQFDTPRGARGAPSQADAARPRRRSHGAGAGVRRRSAAATSPASRRSAASTSTRSTCTRPAGSFNLCPADVCQTTDGVELVRGACPVDAPKTGLQVEGYTPPPEVIAACERIMQTRRHRRRRHRVHDRRPRRQALLLRHQRAVELRRRRGERRRLRSVRAAGRLPGARERGEHRRRDASPDASRPAR